MTQFHAVMIDETGCEFGVTIEAESRDEAYTRLRDDYPESLVDQLESPEDTAARQQRIYADALAGTDYDDEGRPFYANGYDDDWGKDLDEDELAELCLN